MPQTTSSVSGEKIPLQCIVLLAGVPATGKSTFAKYLEVKHGFAHYDLECGASSWPHPELKEPWDRDPVDFLVLLRQCHNRAVLDWGFPPDCYSWIQEFRNWGARLVWFDGDRAAARYVFKKRGAIDVQCFDRQIRAITEANYPVSLDCLVIPALSSDGVVLPFQTMEDLIFGT